MGFAWRFCSVRFLKLSFCVVVFVAFQAYWQEGSAYDWRGDNDNGVLLDDNRRREVSHCRNMFEIKGVASGGPSSVGGGRRTFRGTEYYEDLGRLLPFHPSSLRDSAPSSLWSGLEQLDKTSALISSRGGALPYLPCLLQDYGHDLSRSCFGTRLAGGGKLRIMFAGDSKIRNTFFAFLNLTRDMDYVISYLNTSSSLDDVISHLGEQEVRWTNFDAVSKVNSRLTVSMRFCNFLARSIDDFEETVEVQLLKRMVDGVDDIPDLLVTAYSTWTLLLLDWGYRFPILSIMDRMREVVRVLSSIYERLSRRTRVLVLAESRLKPLAPHEQHMRPAVFADANVEMSERMFFHYMRREAEEKEVKGGLRFAKPLSPLGPSADWLEPDSGGLWWWDSVLPHSLAVRDVCAELYAHNSTHVPLYSALNCRDTNHDGEATQHLAANMLLNLICNRALHLPHENTCCS